MSGAPIRVAVADDQHLFRGAIASLIDQQPDMEVVGHADNGHSAVALVAEQAPHVILLDVEMPTMNGIEAARIISEEHPATSIVMLTVTDDDDALLTAVRLGVRGYLLKDLDPVQLFEVIRAVYAGESRISTPLIGRLMTELRHATPLDPAEHPEDELSHRELEILQLVAEGLSNKEIGVRLSITEGTVKNHVHNALTKLDMDNRIQAAAFIVRRGLGGATH